MPSWPLLLVLGPAPLTTEPPAPAPIYGGEEVGEGEYDAVVALSVNGVLCTGTVVAPRLVLTAAHCVAGVAPNTTIEVFYGPERKAGDSVDSVSFGAHPQFCGTSKCGEEIYDLAYVELSADFVLPEYPKPLVEQDEWDETMRPGATITLVGYGEADDPDAPNMGLGTKRKVDTTISRLTGLGLEFFAGGNGKDTCVGDSGGPAFARLADGTERFAGILSRGSDPCGKGGYYGVPYAALCWVRMETEVDLLPGGCDTCDCLETRPSPDGPCECRVNTPRTDGSWLLALGLLALRRRRR